MDGRQLGEIIRASSGAPARRSLRNAGAVSNTEGTKQPQNGGAMSPTMMRGGGVNKLLLLFLIISLSINAFNMQYILDGQVAVLQDSIYESTAMKEDCTYLGSSSTGEPSEDDETFEPIRFIAVGGPYHTGSTNMWYSLDANIDVVRSRNISIGVFPAGFPPCGVPLFDNFDVDMRRFSGNSSGILDQNKLLKKEWGTVWDDWVKRNSKAKNEPYKHLGAIDNPTPNILDEIPPHKSNRFYTWWKHTPPQHPMMNCFRSDTLYVIMVRHPVAWTNSVTKKPYDFTYDRSKRVWKLDRKGSPRRLPNLQIQFKSLYHAWAFYMNGYLGWESVAAKKNCYSRTALEGDDNCLGGQNNIPSSRRNMILVRQEDYSYDPQGVLAKIFAFATRGAINVEKDKHLFILSEEKSKATNYANEMNRKVKGGYFAAKDLQFSGATKVVEMCERLGYNCDKSSAIFVDEV